MFAPFKKTSIMKIQASELPRHKDGAIYHLNLHPEELADNVILVGDPGRVPVVARLFDRVETKKHNRELVTITGYYGDKRISAISTGMGTDNIDIVLTELDALANIDLKSMEVKTEHRALNVVRIGTSGALQPDIACGSFVAASDGLGIDSLLQFYDWGDWSEEDLANAFIKHTGWGKNLSKPYCMPADPQMLQRIAFDMHQGITVSAPGFFGPQGRQLRIPLRYPNLNARMESFSFNGKRITNMEMECSAIYGLGNLLGHHTLTVCLIIANRTTGEFLDTYQDQIETLCKTVLDRI